MDLSCLLRPQTCCFFLKLKTGCYIIAAWNLFFGGVMFLEELEFAIASINYQRTMNTLDVAFMYDLIPSVEIIFSLALLYGVIKENKRFIFTGVNFMAFLVVDNIDKIVFLYVGGATGTFPKEYLLEFTLKDILSGVLAGACLIVILNHLRQIGGKEGNKNKTETEETTNEFENLTCT